MIYIINITILLLLLLLNQINKSKLAYESSRGIFLENAYFYIGLLMIAITASIRYDVGTDYNNYFRIFETAIKYQDSINNSRVILKLSNVLGIESSYLVINMLIAKLGFAPEFFIGITSFATIFLVGFCIKKISSNPMLSLFLFYLVCFLQLMNIARQYLAGAIVFFAIPLLKEKKYIKFCLVVFLASLIHMSALICLILPILHKIKVTKIVVILYMVGTVASGLLWDVVKGLVIRLGVYSSLLDSNRTMNLISIVPWLIIAFITLIHLKDLMTDPENNLYIHCVMISLLISVMSLHMIYLNRMISYFSIFTILLIPNMLKVIKNSKEKLIIVTGYTVLVLLIFYNNVSDPVTNYLPYKTIYSKEFINFRK